MKQLLFISICIVFFSCHHKADNSQSVNPVIGDVSFVNKYGVLPDGGTDEQLRISTHLEYVEDVLRKKDITSLSPALQKKRLSLLDMLHQYRLAGNFPKNYDHPGERKPCFIDVDGSICAVGYLVEQTAGRDVAEAINDKYKYEELLAMNDDAIDQWIASSGLTKEECAMIQPAYWPAPPPPPSSYTRNNIPKSYGIPSALVSGMNLSLNAVNGVQLIKGTNNKVIPVIGLISGAGQIALGIANFPDDEITPEGTFTNESKKTLSMINVGIGASSMILSAWNLISDRKPKDKSTSWNIYGFPTQDGNTGVAVGFTKRLK